jgi:surface polysaccharide O-acyltransferase-like enzyme
VGTIINVLQVFLFVPPIEYMSTLFSSDFSPGLHSTYILSSTEGGLPGIIKVFAYASLPVYLMSLGLLNFTTLNEVDKHRLKILSIVALVAIVIKVFFALDRLTIMAVLVANIFIGFKKGYMKNTRYWVFISIIFLLANYLSIKRLEDFGIIDFILLYFKMGLVNFQLMLDTCYQHTYGFSTILGPLYFVFKFLNLPLPDFSEINFLWEWNPAQYFASDAFQDFGHFYFVLFYIVGILLCKIDNQVKKNIYINAIYFIVLYGVLTFMFIPAIRGIEFWFALSIPLLLINRFTTSLKLKTNSKKPDCDPLSIKT